MSLKDTGITITARASVSPVEWDDCFGQKLNLCQSHYYARVMSRAHDSRPHFLLASQGERKLAACLLLENSVTNKGRLASAIAGKSMDCIEGPIALPGVPPNDAIEALKAIIVKAELISRGAFKLTWTNAWREGQQEEETALREFFAGRGYSSFEWGSYLLGLIPSEEELLQAADRSVRKALNKCEREGVKSRQVESFDDFERSYLRAYISAQDETDHNAERRLLASSRTTFEEDDLKRYRFLVAETQGGQTLGALGMHVCGGFATEIASCITSEARRLSLPVQDLLHWELIRMAKAMGATSFDFAGVSPAPKNPKEEGIRKFKGKWGGRYVKMLSFEKLFIRGRTVNKLLKIARAIRGLTSE